MLGLAGFDARDDPSGLAGGRDSGLPAGLSGNKHTLLNALYKQ